MAEHQAGLPPTALVIVAAGAGTRMQAKTRKAYLELHGRPLLFHTLDRFAELAFLRERFVVVAPDDVERVQASWPELARDFGVNRVVAGGAERVHSVEAGLAAVGSVEPEVELVAIHDVARPLVSPGRVEQVCRAAASSGAAILAHPISDTLKREAPGEGAPTIQQTVARSGLWAAQTPQVFRLEVLRHAYARWHAEGEPAVTDDAALLERLGLKVTLVKSERSNFKVTTPEDIPFAEALLPRVTR